MTAEKYPFLKELGIDAKNPGVYNGTWLGSGPELVSYNPATNEPIAAIRTATIDEYNATVAEIDRVRYMWAEVCGVGSLLLHSILI